MMLIKTAVLSILASSTAVLAATSCDEKVYVPVSDAQACVDYIRNKGSQECVLDGQSIEFCHAGLGRIRGSNNGKCRKYPVSEKGCQKAPCEDVATGAQAIIDECTKDGKTGGYNDVFGNDNYRVSIDPVLN
ncbi:hypothetical protein BDW62DRAFT_185249 [Aspergillus aurantiobrunneus]